jgi:hypothetical protein
MKAEDAKLAVFHTAVNGYSADTAVASMKRRWFVLQTLLLNCLVFCTGDPYLYHARTDGSSLSVASVPEPARKLSLLII